MELTDKVTCSVETCRPTVIIFAPPYLRLWGTGAQRFGTKFFFFTGGFESPHLLLSVFKYQTRGTHKDMAARAREKDREDTWKVCVCEPTHDLRPAG